jgi:ribosomal protein S4E
MGSGTWTLTSAGTIWGLATATGMTLNANTSTIVLSTTSATAKTFAGGGLTYNNLVIGGATTTSTLTFSGSNTFTGTLSSTKTVAHTITFTSGITTTVANWTVTGTVGNVVTINSSTSTSHNLVKTGGGNISVDYMNISRSNASP